LTRHQSASRRTAGAAGVLTLTHCFERPERYGELISSMAMAFTGIS
jgi:hypothetical protein